MMLKGRHLSLGIAFLMPQIALPCHAQDSLSAYFAPRVSGDMRMRFQSILDFGYFNKVRRPLGEDNLNSVFTGDSFFSNYNLATLIGRVSLFHYATELETGPVGTLRQIESSQTTGVRVLGRRDWENVSIAWEGSYAQQSDYSNNLNDYSADYGLVEISIKPKAFTFKVRGEILGSDNGQGLQTPLASLHRFQGFADKFLRTPDEGVRDYSIFAQYDFGSIADTFSNDTKAVFLTTEISF